MGNVRVDADMDTTGKAVGRAIRDGLGDGIEDAGEWLFEQGREQARDRIRGIRVWRGQVYNGFAPEDGHREGNHEYSTELRNVAPHAEIVERGLAPAGAIPGAHPAVQDIIEWVDSEVAVSPIGSRNVEEWDPDLQVLAAEYGTATVVAAFGVKEHIDTEGYPGIGYMEHAEQWMRRYGPVVVKRKVESAIEAELKRIGV